MSLTPVLMFPQSARQRHGSFHVDKCTEVHISGDSCAQHEAMAGVSLMCISEAGSVQHTGAVMHSKQWGQLLSMRPWLVCHSCVSAKLAVFNTLEL